MKKSTNTFTFVFNQWHVWDNLNNAFLLSNEDTKELKQFKTLDDCVNYLYLTVNDKMAARELNKAMKTNKNRSI